VEWFNSIHIGCHLARDISPDLWNNRVRENGIPTPLLIKFVEQNTAWRDGHLTRMGVPSTWPDTWDFFEAISACTDDTFFHTMWLVMERAIQDFGLAEYKDLQAGRICAVSAEVEAARRKVKEESEHGAMRIAALVSVWC
jgi:hypothetical protein